MAWDDEQKRAGPTDVSRILLGMRVMLAARAPNRVVCDDGRRLRRLQRRIAADWTVVYVDLVGPFSWRVERQRRQCSQSALRIVARREAAVGVPQMRPAGRHVGRS